MDLNELARLIAREVLEQLGEITAGKRVLKKTVMVLANRAGDLADRLARELGEDSEILFLDDNAGESKPSRYILPFLSCGGMADLAYGKASDHFVSEALRLLLSGIKVEVLEFEYKAYEKTAPSALYSLYSGYEKKLTAYGLDEFKHKSPDSWHVAENLVTEKDVLEAGRQGARSVTAPLAAVITPLAADAAGKLNINIVRR